MVTREEVPQAPSQSIAACNGEIWVGAAIDRSSPAAQSF